ncbi:MAG: DUF512 domain-containing protein [Chloroflexia bacterium]
METQLGGVVAQVQGIAKLAGIRPGDRLLEANGHPLRDVIDWAFYADGHSVTVRVARGESTFSVQLCRPAGTAWGIDFAEPLFDGVRHCQNRCLFCFLDQLPPGWRRSIYLRDDDYRLSFLFGNFVTLTNLRESDWQRLEKQHLSPLYVSVHATEPSLRERLLGRKGLPDIREQLERLGRLGIVVHAQVVLCPGINDGAQLERTVADLERLSPPVASVALVPVGLTRFRALQSTGAGETLRTYTPEEAAALWKWARKWQRALRSTLGKTFLYLADEFYLLAGRQVPRAASYDGFPQAENGVGLVRLLLDDWARVRRRRPIPTSRRLRVTLVCGTLIAPTLQRIAAAEEKRLEGLEAQVLPLENRTFGPTVTVSGLLTGETFWEGLRAARGEVVFLPRAAFGEGKETLDGVALEDLQRRFDRPLVLVERWSEVLQALEGDRP